MDASFASTAPHWQAERRAAGKQARKKVPFELAGTYKPAPGRDPLGILAQQNEQRVQDLVPLRMYRMTQDPFAFLRGAAAVMAADLSHEPISGGRTFVCGDAHINNFGVFESPEGRMVFDVNDFDESTIGPWEWDVKRMTASIVLAGRQRKDSETFIEQACMEAVRAYRDSIHQVDQQWLKDRFFNATSVEKKARPGHTDLERVSRALHATVKAAKKRTSSHAADKMTRLTPDGRRVVVDNPPVLTPLEPEARQYVQSALKTYLAAVDSNLQLLLSEYELTDVARRVVGVGSVGTRCYAAVFTGPLGDPLVLQMKQAVLSALVQYGKQEIPPNPILVPEKTVQTPGYRPVQCQRAMQEISDPFLAAVEVGGFGFYVRQFRDENAGVDTQTLTQENFLNYVRSCGAQLAKAHGRSKDGAFAAGYIGHSDGFPQAITTWAHAYAKQSEDDYEALLSAVKDGRFPTIRTA